MSKHSPDRLATRGILLLQRTNALAVCLQVLHVEADLVVVPVDEKLVEPCVLLFSELLALDLAPALAAQFLEIDASRIFDVAKIEVPREVRSLPARNRYSAFKSGVYRRPPIH